TLAGCALRRCGIVGLIFLFTDRARRRTDQRDILPLLLAKGERVESRLPIQVGSAEGRRPFELEIAIERNFNLQRMSAFDFKSNDCARIVHRNEQSLLYRKGVASINDGARFGSDADRTYQRLRGNGTAIRQETHVEIAKNL